MSKTLYQIDAFSSKIFGGNPAAVMILDDWLEDDILLNIAQENNLSETAYAVKREDRWGLRWFTPGGEVKLCGHATLATAHVLATEVGVMGPYVFDTLSGQLVVDIHSEPNTYIMDFPSDNCTQIDVSLLKGVLNNNIIELHEGDDDYVAVLENSTEVKNCNPDLKLLATLPKRGLIVTSTDDKYDFVSRCFYPAYGIDEDPVTGSAHTVLAPYWSSRLRKNNLWARQVSQRGGDVKCIFKGERTTLVGSAVTYLKGEIYI